MSENFYTGKKRQPEAIIFLLAHIQQPTEAENGRACNYRDIKACFLVTTG